MCDAASTSQEDEFDFLPLPGPDCTDKLKFFQNAFRENITNESCLVLARKVIAIEKLRGTPLYESAERVLFVLNSKEFYDRYAIKCALIQLAYVKQISGRN